MASPWEFSLADAERQNEALKHALTEAVLKTPAAGGTSGGMEARVAKLEAALEHVQADVAEIKIECRGLRADARGDFRIIFGAIIAVALGLAGLMAHGFHWI